MAFEHLEPPCVTWRGEIELHHLSGMDVVGCKLCTTVATDVGLATVAQILVAFPNRHLGDRKRHSHLSQGVVVARDNQTVVGDDVVEYVLREDYAQHTFVFVEVILSGYRSGQTAPIRTVAQADATPLSGIVLLVVEHHLRASLDGFPVEAAPRQILVAIPS